MDWLQHVGKNTGHFKTKENRAQRLIDNWQDIEAKMVGLVEKGKGKTETARCAYGILLMMETGIRVGNETSAEGRIADHGKHRNERPPFTAMIHTMPFKVKNFASIKPHIYGSFVQTYGLTTLQVQHIQKNGIIHLSFTGKKVVEQELYTKHPTLMTYYKDVVGDSKDTDLFLNIDYLTLKRFCKKRIGRHFKIKDLRTACVNKVFIKHINSKEHKKSISTITKKGDMKKALKSIIVSTAEEIGHTPGVCKSAYISKVLMAEYTQYLLELCNKNKGK